jgi:hypothetical protein
LTGALSLASVPTRAIGTFRLRCFFFTLNVFLLDRHHRGVRRGRNDVPGACMSQDALIMKCGSALIGAVARWPMQPQASSTTAPAVTSAAVIAYH